MWVCQLSLHHKTWFNDITWSPKSHSRACLQAIHINNLQKFQTPKFTWKLCLFLMLSYTKKPLCCSFAPPPHPPFRVGRGERVDPYLFIYLLISIRTCRLRGRVDIFSSYFFFLLSPLIAQSGPCPLFPLPREGKSRFFPFFLAASVGGFQGEVEKQAPWSPFGSQEHRHLPLTSPEQWQTLVLGGHSRRLPGGRICSPDRP